MVRAWEAVSEVLDEEAVMDIHEVEVMVDEANGRMLAEMTRRVAVMLAEAREEKPFKPFGYQTREGREEYAERLYAAALKGPSS